LARCKSNRVVVVRDFNFPEIDWGSLRAQNVNGAEFVRSIQEGFLKHYIDSPTREVAVLDLVLGNEPGQVVNISVGEQFGNSDQNSVSFKVLMDKDKYSPRVKVLNRGKANHNNLSRELKNVDWGQIFEGKSTSGMWEAKV